MSTELRKDYLFERWSVIAFKRKARPMDFKTDHSTNNKKCFFCPGNEEEETRIGQIPKKGPWKIRWIHNKYPAISVESQGKSINSLFYKQKPGYGFHEVIIETPVHGQSIHELPLKDFVLVMKVYQERFIELSKRKGIKYVVLFKNHGPKAGASLAHEHAQVVAQTIIPSYVKAKLDLIKGKKCPYCKILNLEKKTNRLVFEDEHFVSFTPFSPRFAHEVWLMPKKHIKSYSNLNNEELVSMAKMLKKILKKMSKLSDSFNFTFFNSPSKGDLHFHIEIFPRTSTWAGYEFQTGDYILSTPPEESARFYRNG